MRTLLAIHQKYQKPSLWEVVGSFVLVAYASLTASRTLLTITSLSELYSRFRRFFLLVQTKKVISMNFGSSTSSWKPWGWVRFDLILTMRDKYIDSNLNSLPKFTISSRSTELKDTLPWNISQIITKTVTINTGIIINCAMKWDIIFWVYWKVDGNWDNSMIRVSQWRESDCWRSTRIRRKK